MNTIDELQDFIKRAERNYKYKPGTASALRSTLKLFGTVMTEEEKASKDALKERTDEIANRLYQKYPDKYNADSLMTYKSRINRVLRDFTQYGKDAQSMASWNPLENQRVRQPSLEKKTEQSPSKKNESHKVTQETKLTPVAAPQGTADLHLPLSGSRNIVIYYPTDLSEIEAEKVGRVLQSIASLSEEMKDHGNA